MKIYNKLVRDKIPEIIEGSGRTAETVSLSDENYVIKLHEKLLEECNEVIEAFGKNSKIEELADVLEVIYAIADKLGITYDELDRVRLEKKEKRGAFSNKIMLISVEEVEDAE